MKAIFSCLLLFISFHGICQYDAIKPQGIYSSSFIIDEKPRNITYYMPVTYGKQEDYPLLIIFPADKSDAAATIKKYGDIIQSKADSAGCIVLYPDAYKSHWNTDVKDTVNDVGFISIMADFFLRQFDCDLSQIKLLGIGNGGNLCYRIGCESHHKPASIATINTNENDGNFPDCKSNKAIPQVNLTDAANLKANIEKALNFLFTRKEEK